MAIKLALELEGYQVVEAENGSIAQEKLISDLKPCVILLDLMMPVMNGQEFLEWKNNDSVNSLIPVVVISALAQHIELPGTVKFLLKPIDLTTIIATVAEVCL